MMVLAAHVDDLTECNTNDLEAKSYNTSDVLAASDLSISAASAVDTDNNHETYLNHSDDVVMGSKKAVSAYASFGNRA